MRNRHSERPGRYYFRGGATCKGDRCENDFKRETTVYIGLYGRIFNLPGSPSGIAGGVYGRWTAGYP